MVYQPSREKHPQTRKDYTLIISPFDPKDLHHLAAGHEKLIMEVHSKQKATEFAFTIQIISLVLRESTFNQNTKKVCSIRRFRPERNKVCTCTAEFSEADTLVI